MKTVEIRVEKQGDWEFRVEVEEGESKTTHTITLAENFAAKLDLSPEEVVKKSFEFLLARESKESILSSFSIPDTIIRYFPGFQDKIAAN